MSKPTLPFGLSTTALHGMSLSEKFSIVKDLGFDGIEVMVTHNRDSHSYEVLRDLSKHYELPVLSIHAPTLLLTHFVWGTNPKVKLQRAASHAALTGAKTVVVHPPFRVQRAHGPSFLAGVRDVNAAHNVHIAVENMYPWYVGGREVPAYAPNWRTITEEAGADSLTFDFSHATVAGLDIVAEASRIAPRLRHIHLSDSLVGNKHDTHLPPGRGNLPLAETFQALHSLHWRGNVVAEINTIRQVSRQKQLDVLRETHDRGRELLS